jgi:hypothetical protein
MTDHFPVSILATALHVVSARDALDFVDTQLGLPSEWGSQLTKYRLASDFQSDWKAEVGQWLKTAERHGYLATLKARVIKMAKSNAQIRGRAPPILAHIGQDKVDLTVREPILRAKGVWVDVQAKTTRSNHGTDVERDGVRGVLLSLGAALSFGGTAT